MISASAAEPEWRQAPGNHCCLAVPSPQTAVLGHSRLPQTRFISRETPADGARLSETLREPGPGSSSAGGPGSCRLPPSSWLAAGGKGGKQGCKILGGPALTSSRTPEAVRRSAPTPFNSANAPWPASHCFQHFIFQCDVWSFQ